MSVPIDITFFPIPFNALCNCFGKHFSPLPLLRQGGAFYYLQRFISAGIPSSFWRYTDLREDGAISIIPRKNVHVAGAMAIYHTQAGYQ